MTMEDTGLEPLVTECPHCSTRFRVTEQQLQLAAGRVRCGACLTVFQGVERLVWDEPSEFESEEEAQHALDALLEELEPTDDRLQTVVSGESAAAGAPAAQAGAALQDDSALQGGDDDGPGWLGAGHQLYGGHEQDAATEPTDIVLDEHHWPGARARAAEADGAEQAPGGIPADTPHAAEPDQQPADTVTAGEPEGGVAIAGPGSSVAGAVGEQASSNAATSESGAEPAAEIAAEQAAEQSADAPTAPAEAAAESTTMTLAQRIAQGPEPTSVEAGADFQFGEARKWRWWVPVAIVVAGLALLAQVLW